MTLPDPLTQRIQRIAEREGKSPEALVEQLLDAYENRTSPADAIEAFIGAFDDDIPDLSTTVRQTLKQKFN